MLQDERSSESDMDQGPSSSSSSSEDLTNLDDAEIVGHCIKKLKESSGDVHLKWLQQQFCDVAYAKYGKIIEYKVWQIFLCFCKIFHHYKYYLKRSTYPSS